MTKKRKPMVMREVKARLGRASNERSPSISARALLDFVEENAGEMTEGLEQWDRDIFWNLYRNYIFTREPHSESQRSRTRRERKEPA